MKNRKKRKASFSRVLSLILAFVLMMSSALPLVVHVQAAVDNPWDGSTLTMPAADSDGTYLIKTGAELAWFADQVNKGNSKINGSLQNTIYVNNYDTSYEWPMIGESTEHPYSGIFNGNGYKINYLYAKITMDIPEKRYAGLFGVIDGGTVSNVSVGGTIRQEYGNYGEAGGYDETYMGSGGIAGYLVSGTIAGCVNQTKTQMAGECMYRNSGGIVGLCKGLVLRCENRGTISTSVSFSQRHIGGIAGMVYGGEGKILYSQNITAVQGYFEVGGIAGAVKYGAEIESCCNYGKVSANSILGGIAGNVTQTATYTDGSTKECQIRNVYNLGELGSIRNGSASTSGGIVGQMGPGNWTEESLPPQPVLENAYSTVQYKSEVYASKGALVGYFKSGVIGNVYALSCDGLDLCGSRDNKTTTYSGSIEFKTDSQLKSTGMIKLLGASFVKTNKYDYDNAGYPKLKWQGQTSDLAERVDQAILELRGWLTVDNQKKYGTEYTKIVSIVEKYVEELGNVVTDEDLDNTMKKAREELEAVKPGQEVNNELIEAIDNAIISLEQYQDELLEQYPDLTAEQEAELQAVVEEYEAKLEQAKSTDEVKIILRDGKDGLDAKIAGYEEEKRIEEVRSNALKTLETYRNTTDYGSPWMEQIQEARKAGSKIIQEAVSVADITDALTQAKKSIDEIINQIPVEGAWDGSTLTEPKADGDGVFQITSGSELAWFASQANSGVSGTQYISGILCNDINLGRHNWTPIGAGVTYQGSFDGQGYTIQGFYINEADTYAGLFGQVYGTDTQSIQNINIVGSIDCDKNVDYAGAIVAHIHGQNDSIRNSIYNCHSSVDITIGHVTKNGASVGGIAGYARYTWFRQCSNTASVVIASEGKGGINYYSGGILGSAEAAVSLRQSYNSGYVEAAFCAGGLVGKIAGTNCALTSDYNYGEIYGNSYAGGIAGWVSGNADGSRISWSYTSGPVNLNKSGYYIGALLGGIQTGSYENLYALKRIDQSSRALVGHSADNTAPGIFLNDTELKSEDTLNSLNSGGNYFIHDYLGYQSAYPIFSWQLSLNDLKNGAITELQNFAAESDYTAENWEKVQAIIAAGISQIQEAGSMEAVNAALTEAKQAIYEIETNADAMAKALQEAKDAAIESLNQYTDLSEYREEEQNKIAVYLSDAIKWISRAETIEEVNQYLEETKEKIEALPTAKEYEYETDQKAAAQVDSYILDIGEVTLSGFTKTNINIARTAYDALTDTQKALVDQYQTLLDAEEAYQKLLDEGQVTEEDEKLAAQVDSLINSIGAVTLDSRSAIEKARHAYDGLSELQKTLVKYPEVLTNAESTFNQLRANEAIQKIAALGTITLDSQNAINEARTIYNALSEAQKKLVTDYPVLQKAETMYRNLVAAQAVIDLINQIGSVSLDRQSVIVSTINAYNALSGDQQALVTNYHILEAAAAEYDSLSKIDAVETLISQIGTVTSSSGSSIANARNAYNNLSAEEQARVSNLSVLSTAEAAYEALQQQQQEETPEAVQTRASSYHSATGNNSSDENSTPDAAAKKQTTTASQPEETTASEEISQEDETKWYDYNLSGTAYTAADAANPSDPVDTSDQQSKRMGVIIILSIILASVAVITTAILISMHLAAKRRKHTRVHF